MNVLVFAGTTEGRQFSKRLISLGKYKVFVSVATEYGKEGLCIDSSFSSDSCTIFQGRLDSIQMKKLMIDNFINAVVDATHPYAKIVSENIKETCDFLSIPYYRYCRTVNMDYDAENLNVKEFSSLEKLCDFLSCTDDIIFKEGNIFVSTGSKELECFTKIPSYKERLYVRVLPTCESIEKCKNIQIPSSHIIAMQGPFSRQMNEAMFKEYDIRHLVTKESGTAGGFLEKIEAAKECNVNVLMIKPPKQISIIYSEDEILKELQRFMTC